ncbi:MAG: hypothetical protein MK077_02255 [Phycisphaerales bacterium]|nr:hypothetical protein [Phycisphaerales bacterium]
MKPMGILILMCLTTLANADSGLVRLSEPLGPWKVTLLTDPTPLREGPVDFSVLVQSQDTGETLLDADVSLDLTHSVAGLIMTVPASTEVSENAMLHAAKFVLPEPGQWSGRIKIQVEDHKDELTFEFTAAPPLPAWTSWWPWLIPAPVALCLYAANRRLAS